MSEDNAQHRARPEALALRLRSIRNIPAAYWFQSRGRGVSNGHDRDGERSDFSVFSLRATKRQASAQPVRRDLNDRQEKSYAET
jgi:hypothetical protein